MAPVRGRQSLRARTRRRRPGRVQEVPWGLPGCVHRTPRTIKPDPPNPTSAKTQVKTSPESPCTHPPDLVDCSCGGRFPQSVPSWQDAGAVSVGSPVARQARLRDGDRLARHALCGLPRKIGLSSSSVGAGGEQCDDDFGATRLYFPCPPRFNSASDVPGGAGFPPGDCRSGRALPSLRLAP